MLIPKDTFDDLMSRAGSILGRARLLLASTYAVLVGAAVLWMFIHAQESPFAGVLAVLLTLPWSLLALPLAIFLPNVFDGSLLPGTLLIGAGACVNVRLLLHAGAKRDSSRRH